MLTPVEYYSMRNQHRVAKLLQVGKQVGYSHLRDIGVKAISSGMTFLSCGAFASAYKLLADRDVVVKTFPVKSEDSYGEYLRWVLDRQDCPYVPKIYKVQQINGLFCVYMKRYSKNVDAEAAKDVYSTIGQTHQVAGDFNFNRLSKYGDSFVKLMKDLYYDFKDYHFDLHLENIMFDEDGTPVITDPITTKRENNERIINLDVKVDWERFNNPNNDLYNDLFFGNNFKIPSIKIEPTLKCYWNNYQENIIESVPKFKMKDLVIPKFKPILNEPPFWQKDNKWA